MCIRDSILAGSQDVIQAAEADVVCPAVTTEDPDGLLGDELLALQDLSGLGAASGSSLLQLSEMCIRDSRPPAEHCGSCGGPPASAGRWSLIPNCLPDDQLA